MPVKQDETSYRAARRYAPAERGGSTSVRGRIHNPHSSAGMRGLAGLGAPWDRQTERQTDGRIWHRLMPLRWGHKNSPKTYRTKTGQACLSWSLARAGHLSFTAWFSFRFCVCLYYVFCLFSFIHSFSYCISTQQTCTHDYENSVYR